MARIRTIKPEFPQSESMGRITRDARLLFVQLWTIADDSGRLRGNSRMLASLLYPYDDDASLLMQGWLQELSEEGCIQCYEVDRDSYIQVLNWHKHQKIDKPSASKIPAPTWIRGDLANIREDSPKALERSCEDRDQGPKDQGEDISFPPPAAPPDGVGDIEQTSLSPQGQNTADYKPSGSSTSKSKPKAKIDARGAAMAAVDAATADWPVVHCDGGDWTCPEPFNCSGQFYEVFKEWLFRRGIEHGSAKSGYLPTFHGMKLASGWWSRHTFDEVYYVVSEGAARGWQGLKEDYLKGYSPGWNNVSESGPMDRRSELERMLTDRDSAIRDIARAELAKLVGGAA